MTSWSCYPGSAGRSEGVSTHSKDCPGHPLLRTVPVTLLSSLAFVSGRIILVGPLALDPLRWTPWSPAGAGPASSHTFSTRLGDAGPHGGTWPQAVVRVSDTQRVPVGWGPFMLTVRLAELRAIPALGPGMDPPALRTTGLVPDRALQKPVLSRVPPKHLGAGDLEKSK